MSEICAVCGAVLPEGSTCQSIFDDFLNLEFTNPAYGEVHYLTVTCFMVQHERYSDEALIWTQATLKAYFDEQLTAHQLRQRAAQATNRSTYTWKVTRRTDAPPLPRVVWSMTIANVARSIQDSEKYCEQVRRWARATLQQMESLLS
jgi:Family of unknown function (DUF5946)